jgi:negative regulator of flagellin synthesis FlgM
MTVDFNGIGPGQVNSKAGNTAGKAAQKTEQPAPEQTKTQSARPDSVNLSDQARDLKKLEAQLDRYPEVDDARVEQIRSALADGSYKVDADKLAQKMLETDESIFG